MTKNQGYLDDLKKSPYSMEWWDSHWEREYMKELEQDNHVAKWTKNHSLRIKYFDSNNNYKTYSPDFLVENIDGSIELVEMKGTHLLKNPDTQKKIEFAKKWCEARKIKYRIISKYQ